MVRRHPEPTSAAAWHRGDVSDAAGKQAAAVASRCGIRDGEN
ncbi:MAG: hypothetical protein ACOC8X_02715 [Chloroflexota bacterium]